MQFFARGFRTVDSWGRFMGWNEGGIWGVQFEEGMIWIMGIFKILYFLAAWFQISQIMNYTIIQHPQPPTHSSQSPNLCKRQDAHNMRTASPWAASPRRSPYDADRMILINFTHQIKQYREQMYVKTILLAVLVSWTRGLVCPIPPSEQTQVISDSVEVRAQNGQHIVSFDYRYEEPMERDPQLAVGIDGFQSQGLPTMEIKIEKSEAGQDGIEFLVKSGQASQWKTLQINFIATTREDMEFGNAVFANEQGLVQESFQLEYPMQRNFSLGGLKVKPFLQGFDMESQDQQTVGVRLHDSDIEEQSVHFTFLNPNRSSLVRSLSLTIILFNIYTPGILYADGIIDQNYVTSVTDIQIVRHGIVELRTYMVGINSFQSMAGQPLSISAAIDDTFTLKIGPLNRKEVEFISVSYLILSVIQCGACEGYPILFEDVCRAECPVGYRIRNGRCVEIVCSPGFSLYDGVCRISCPINEDYKDGKCDCMEGYNRIGGTCIRCPSGTYFNALAMVCSPVCGNNAYYMEGRCYCYPGYNIINSSCAVCPYGAQYNPSTYSCDSICNQNEAYDNGVCACKPDTYNISGTCGVCPTSAPYNASTQQCSCQPGYQYSTIAQKCVKICSQYELKVDEYCVCKFQIIDGVCGQCPQNSRYNKLKQTCDCSYSFRKVDGKCVCSDQEVVEDGMCQRRCPLSEEWVNGECVCMPDEVRDESGDCYPSCPPNEERIRGECVCVEGYHRGVSTPCVPITCPDGFVWNSQRRECRSACQGPSQIQIDGECECVAGYERQMTYGLCLPSCPSNQIRINGVCQCSAGNKYIDGVCTDCPRYTQYVAGFCLCYNGKLPVDGECQKVSCPDVNHIYDSSTKSCRCKGPLVWMHGRCQYLQGCGENQYWCGTSCVCNYGYVRVRGVCEKSSQPITNCPPSSTFNGVNCVCDYGSYPIRQNVCGQCEDHAYWDGSRCNTDPRRTCVQGYRWNGVNCYRNYDLCGENEYWDGSFCVCKQGYHFIGGVCTQCPRRTVFDGEGCTGMLSVDCMDPYKFWNGQACVCIPDFFPYGNSCVRCPEETWWNGHCCEYPRSYLALLVVANGY